jgi:streptogramin lyase
MLRVKGASYSTLLVLILAILLPLSAQAVEYTVSTYAGGGSTAGCSATATATNAVNVNSPWGIATDSAGNVYYSNRGTFSICKITTNGTVVRVAGTGVSGTGADNIQATSSALGDPMGVAVDSTGVLYIADYGLSRSIRRVGLDGVITTILNTSRLTTVSGTGGLATAAGSSGPLALAIAPNGDIYFSDYQSNYIRRIDSSGYVRAVAGTGLGGNNGDGGAATSATVSQVAGLAFDSAGNLYLASYGGTIRMVSTAGTISKVAGSYSTIGHTGNDGPANSATFRNLWGIAIDAADNIFVPERGQSPLGTTIRKVNISTGIVTVIAGLDGSGSLTDGQSSAARFNSPYGVAIGPNGDLFVADLGTARIRKIAQAAATSASGSAPSLSTSTLGAFRTTSSITATGGASGKITFFANGKRISGCISITYSGSHTCSWKPTIRGAITVTAKVVTSNNETLATNSVSVTALTRATRR